MELREIKNDMIRDYLSEFTQLNLNNLDILKNNDIWLTVIDKHTYTRLTISQLFDSLFVYVNDSLIGSFYQRECHINDGTRKMCWVVGKKYEPKI